MATLMILGIVFLVMVAGIVLANLEDSDSPKAKRFLKKFGIF